MSDHDRSDHHSASWQGLRLSTDTEAELEEALAKACDYRGDITIHLKTGEQVVGYVFDRQDRIPDRHIMLFLPDQAAPATVRYQDITAIEFSGEDMAFGRSWEDWIQKWQKLKES